MKTTSTLLTLLLALTFGLPLPAAPATQEVTPPVLLPKSEQEKAQQEMQQLFLEVERELRAIDLFLSDASAGDVPLDMPQDSGLDNLLRETTRRSDEVLQRIDRILEIASSMAPPKGGGQSSSQEPPSGGESPLDQDRPQTQSERENTPDKPGGEQPQPNPEGDPQQPEDGPDREADEAQNREGQNPPDANRGNPSAGQGAERWGELPPTAREVFRSEGGGDLPVRYRDWIDSYYKRLNTRP